MALVNEHFLDLPENYLFSDIARRVNEYKTTHPKANLIRLGIGDVTRPLPNACVEAMRKAADELRFAGTFKGYGPERGYDFLIEAILKHEYAARNVILDSSEIFISDGAKCDTSGIVDIFRSTNSIGITDPAYPVYIDSNAIWGRTGSFNSQTGMWDNITYLPCTEQNHFIPAIPEQKIDLLYLCFPNNPTGVSLTYEQLKSWVDYALRNETIILFDAAYERFITRPNVPHSIYEIKGAKQCAIEFRSFSKTAGFTGVRCGFTVIPKELTARTQRGECVSLNKLWLRRQCTKFNGTSYITQRGAEAIYSTEGKAQVENNIAYYQNNAALMKQGLVKAGFQVWGGTDSPYLWLKTPHGESSWDYFEHLLHKAQVITTPGIGFGPAGEHYIRLTAFNEKALCEEAIHRILQYI